MRYIGLLVDENCAQRLGDGSFIWGDVIGKNADQTIFIEDYTKGVICQK